MNAKHARAFYVAKDGSEDGDLFRILTLDPLLESSRDFKSISEVADYLRPLITTERETEIGAVTPLISGPIISPLFAKSGIRPNEDDLSRLRELANSMYGDSADSCIPAGYTYVGQFIAHELCRSVYIDQSGDAVNEGTFALELSSIYDSNPRIGTKLELGATSLSKKAFFDIKRASDGSPQIGNSRNDANAALSQLHCAVVRFHNALADNGRFGTFEDIQRQVILSFQAIVLQDWLPRLTSTALIESILNGRRYTCPGATTHCPAEAVLAVFRIGHSMVRHHYLNWNDVVGSATTLNGIVRSTHLGGGLIDGKMPWNWPVHWRAFFEFEANPAGFPLRARKIDTVVDEQLSSIDPRFLDTERQELSLAFRTLWFGARSQIQDGWFIQDELSRAVGSEEFCMTEDNLPPSSGVAAELFQIGEPLGRRPPLWWFILREAEVTSAAGGGLGGVGARLLAETVVCSIEASEVSILSGEPIAPGLPGSADLRATMPNLLQWGNQPLDWYRAGYS